MERLGNQNFSSIIKRLANENPDKEILKFQENSITNKELNKRVSALAQGLRDLGVEKGDRVALLLYNCIEFFEIIFAVNRLGAVFLPLNYRLEGEELRYILQNAGAKVLISESEFQYKLKDIRIKELEHYVSIDNDIKDGWKSYDKLWQVNLGVEVEDKHVELDSLHRLMYTSGTTSRPKGVMISYQNLYWKNIGLIWNFNINSEDKTLIVGPLYHVGALDLPASAVLYRGGSVVLLKRFNAEELLSTIEKERPTNIWLPPAIINMLLQYKNITEYNLDSIRFIIAGGERMPEPLVKDVLKLFKNAWFCDAYGMTETVSGDTFLPQSKTIEKLGSVGKPCIHLDMKIVDANGKEMKQGEIGEIAFRGPKVTKGYWNNEEATKQAIKDGWFHTGDMGYVDKEGYLYITDRMKDMIVSGGENIASLEVERVLCEHPKILEVAVIGIPHKKWGEVPKAFIVPKKHQTINENEIIEFCKNKIANFKIPKEIEIMSELPRNPSGKVLKRILKETKKEISNEF